MKLASLSLLPSSLYPFQKDASATALDEKVYKRVQKILANKTPWRQVKNLSDEVHFKLLSLF